MSPVGGDLGSLPANRVKQSVKNGLHCQPFHDLRDRGSRLSEKDAQVSQVGQVDERREAALAKWRAEGFTDTVVIMMLAYAKDEMPTSIRALALSQGLQAQRRPFSKTTFHRALQEHPEAREMFGDRVIGRDGKSYPATRERRVVSEEMLRLRYDEGLSFQQLADHFGLSRQTVTRLIYRAQTQEW